MPLLPLVLLAGCVSLGRTSSEPELDGKVMFDCRLAAGSPHERIQVLLPSADLVGGELSPSDYDDDEPVLPGGAGEPIDEEAVVLITGVREPGIGGHCGTRHEPQAGGARYRCSASDGSLALAWPAGGGPATEAAVEVSESWLFGTKHYRATCRKKA